MQAPRIECPNCRFTTRPAHARRGPFLTRRPPWRVRAIQLSVTPLAIAPSCSRLLRGERRASQQHGPRRAPPAPPLLPPGVKSAPQNSDSRRELDPASIGRTEAACGAICYRSAMLKIRPIIRPAREGKHVTLSEARAAFRDLNRQPRNHAKKKPASRSTTPSAKAG